MFEVKPVWTAIHLQLALKKPIMEWHYVPGRFFTMIYDALHEIVPVNSKEFSKFGQTRLSDIRALYSIYGGASSVALSPDALLFDFPQLIPADTSIVHNILLRVHDAFQTAFPELDYNEVNLQSYQHLEFPGEEFSRNDYLTRFAIPKTKNLESIVAHPSARFELVSEEPTWRCTVVVERSLANARAVFVTLNMSIGGVEASSPYEHKAAIVRTIIRMCHDLLELGTEDATA